MPIHKLFPVVGCSIERPATFLFALPKIPSTLIVLPIPETRDVTWSLSKISGKDRFRHATPRVLTP